MSTYIHGTSPDEQRRLSLPFRQCPDRRLEACQPARVVAHAQVPDHAHHGVGEHVGVGVADAALGGYGLARITGPLELARFRRYAVVGAFAGGALLSPGTDLVSMIMMTIPLLLLYEVGYAGAAVIQRRRRKADR